MSEHEQPLDAATERAVLERERIELERGRNELERQRLDHARTVAEHGRECSRLLAAWMAPLVAALAAFLGLAAVAWQIHASRDAADARARVEQDQQATRDRSDLKLAAVSVVLAAATCSSAEARAQLALAVLGPDLLGADFVEKVKRVRVGAFPNGIYQTFIAGYAARPLVPKTSPYAKFNVARTAAQRSYEEALAKSRRDRELLCRELGG